MPKLPFKMHRGRGTKATNIPILLLSQTGSLTTGSTGCRVGLRRTSFILTEDPNIFGSRHPNHNRRRLFESQAKSQRTSAARNIFGHFRTVFEYCSACVSGVGLSTKQATEPYSDNLLSRTQNLSELHSDKEIGLRRALRRLLC